MAAPQDRCVPCKITTIHNYSILYNVELKETCIHHAVWWAYVTTLVRRRNSLQNFVSTIGLHPNSNNQSRNSLGRGSFVSQICRSFYLLFLHVFKIYLNLLLLIIYIYLFNIYYNIYC